MSDFEPSRPDKSARIVIKLKRAEKRLDAVLLKALRDQNENLNLREISRTTFKDLFSSGKIVIKGQKARPSSALAVGTTYIDILGY